MSEDTPKSTTQPSEKTLKEYSIEQSDVSGGGATKNDTFDAQREKILEDQAPLVDEFEDIDIKVVNDLAMVDDDPTMICFTFRAVLVGILLSCLSSSVNQLMQFKPVGKPLTDTFMLMVAYVLCNAWARYLPQGGWLNPSPFTLKEHTCIFVMVSAANTSAYATHILSAQQLYYNDVPNAAGAIFLLLATQLVGYGIAGQLRPFLVYPSNMIWPTSLPTVSLLRTLNSSKEEARWRTRFFFIAFLGIFVYEFIPQYMFPLMGGVSIFCLAKNDSVWFQRIFGGLAVNEGLGILQLSFDWNYVATLSPLVLPFWVQLNIFTGILILWISYPVLYHLNVWNAQSFPFLSNSIYAVNETTGEAMIYPQHLVLNADNSLNHTRFEEVGPPQFSMTFAIQYIFINFAVTASISHVLLFYGKDIWNNFRMARKKMQDETVDVHMRLMAAYKEVPNWWYYTIFVTGIALNIGISYVNHTQLPWWGVIVAIAMSSLLSLPLNMISAITGTGFGLNVLAEMICGFIFPGLPVANMFFKTLGYNTMSQAGNMAQDLKIGHYLKVPPRMIFMNQIVGTVVGSIFNYIVNYSVVSSQRDILLNPVGSNVWNGSGPQTINSAAITWGAIGPLAMFGPHTQYSFILWAFFVGMVLPVPGWLLHKKFPKSGFNYINIPMVLVGLTILPGAASSYITTSFMVVVVSQWYIKRRYHTAFVKYNYLISAAFDSGTSLMVFFVAFTLMGGGDGNVHPFPNWWGNRQDITYVDQCCMNCKP